MSVSHYYEVVKSCLEERGTWEKVIRKFPPKALEAAVAKILERIEEWRADPETFDWCVLFEDILDYDTIESFIQSLVDKGYLPKTKDEMLSEIVSQYEKELAELGYMVVPKEVFVKYVTTGKNYEAQIKSLKEKIRKLEHDLEKARRELLAYKEGRILPLTVYGELAKRLEERKAEEVKKGAAVVEARQRPELKAELRYGVRPPLSEVIARIRDHLTRVEGFPEVFVEDLIEENFEAIKVEYELADPREVVGRVITWIKAELIPRLTRKVTSGELRAMGVEVRPPNPVSMVYMGRRVVAPPPISWVYPRFMEWFRRWQETGFIWNVDLVLLHPGKTHIIHDPFIGTEAVTCLVTEDQKLMGCNTEVLAYMLDMDRRILYSYRYRPIAMLRI